MFAFAILNLAITIVNFDNTYLYTYCQSYVTSFLEIFMVLKWCETSRKIVIVKGHTSVKLD